jgi:hypothetical protein
MGLFDKIKRIVEGQPDFNKNNKKPKQKKNTNDNKKLDKFSSDKADKKTKWL